MSGLFLSYVNTVLPWFKNYVVLDGVIDMTSIIRNQKVNPRKLEKAKEFRENMTCAEKMLWERLRGNKLDGLHFRRQQVIEGYIVDFYCHSVRLVIEVDGKIHERQKFEDQLREQALIDKGLKILRIRNEEIQIDIQSVLGKILEICRSASIEQ